MAESRREREKVITEYRRQADEKKEFAEKVDRRVRERGKWRLEAGMAWFHRMTRFHRMTPPTAAEKNISTRIGWTV